MASILIVSGSYDPYPSANAVCMMFYEQALKQRGHTVEYLIKKHLFTQDDTETINGNSVHFVGDAFSMLFILLNKACEMPLPGIHRTIFRGGYLCLRALFHGVALLQGKSGRQLVQRHFHQAYQKRLIQIVQANKPDLIISVAMPFFSHSSVRRALDQISGSGRRIPWIVFSFDAYATKNSLTPHEKISRLLQEGEVFSAADRIILLHEIAQDYSGEVYQRYHNKMSELPLPNLSLTTLDYDPNNGINKDHHYIDFVFTGTLYDGSSSIRFFTDFIRSLDHPRYRYHIMGKIYPENNALLQQCKLILRDRLLIYGRMSHEYALASIMKGDVLINIGNSNPNQVPSKIFEYFRTGKPIVTFTRTNDDRGLTYLERYPLSYIIQEIPANLSVSNLDSFSRFCEASLSQHVSLDYLRQAFSGLTQEEVTAKFVDIVETLIAKNRCL